MKANLNREFLNKAVDAGLIDSAEKHDLQEEIEQLEYRVDELIEKTNRVDDLEKIVEYHDSLINNKSYEILSTEFTIEELAKIIIRERKRKHELQEIVDKINKYAELGKAFKAYYLSNKVFPYNSESDYDLFEDCLLDWYRNEVKNA